VSAQIWNIQPAAAIELLPQALAARLRGERFFIQFDMLDDRLAVAAKTIADIVRRKSDPDTRRLTLDALGAGALTIDGHPQNQLSSFTVAMRAAADSIAALSDGVIVHSSEAAGTLARTFGISGERFVRQLPTRRELALPVNYRRGSAVIVYAPELAPELTALVVHALDGLARHVVVIGDRTLCAGTTAEFSSDPLRDLASAAAIVVVEPNDPGVALALAAIGAPLAVTTTSGAREFVDGASIFQPWNRQSILAAANSAVGAAAPRVRRMVGWDLPELPEPSVSGKLVSLVMRTKNRRAWLARALASCAAQTYAPLEVVLVNDGGEPVDDLAMAYPFVRAIVNETSVGPTGALVAGMNAARGAYLGLLDDDDVIAADHCARLVDALERSGAMVAHSDAISLYANPSATGYDLAGTAVFLNGSVRPDVIMKTCNTGPMCTLMRREALASVGGYDPSMPFAEDWELLMRLAAQFDIVHVAAITAAYTIRSDGTNMMTSQGAAALRALERIREKFPLADRPLVHEMREQMIAQSKAQAGLANFPAPTVTFAGEALV